MPYIKVVGRNSLSFEAFCRVFCNSSFTGEVSVTANLERWEDADVRLLITTYVDNKHLFEGKATKKDSRTV